MSLISSIYFHKKPTVCDIVPKRKETGPMIARTVLVTGGSSGIGRATVKRFARGGDRVWFTYLLGREQACELVERLAAEGMDQVAALEFDQGNWESHLALLERLPESVDVLINNAAMGSKTVERYAPADERAQDLAMFRVNSIGPLWLARQYMPGMLEHGYGKIVNISSVGGGVAQYPGFRWADGMSKAALAFFSRQLSAELVHAPVDVFAVCPGAVETSMFQASTLERLSGAQRAEFVFRLPKRRLIQPEEIAELVWWLCGDDARVLHGAVIDASLGLGVHPGLLTGSTGAGAVVAAGGET
jgi:NAD(P)-dependent dehydrogenase (short-subunit alcohol dehydrogenase family)